MKQIEFEEEKRRIENSSQPIVIFGCMALGRIAKRTIEAWGRQLACFCDNNSKKQGTMVDGAAVLSPEQVKEEYADAIVIMCSFKPETIKEIHRQLGNAGFKDLVDADIILWSYQVHVMHRKICAEKLEQAIHRFRSPQKNDTILKNVLIFTTEKCSLRCRECSAFVQYIHNPVHYNKAVIIESMKTLAAAADVIEYFTILGGEPLLHPDIAEICEEAARLPNVLKVRIVTNGTIVPKTDFLARVQKSLFYADISNYGEHSRHRDEAAAAFLEHGIFCEIYGADVPWYKIFIPQEFHRSEAENRKRYQTCIWRSESTILQDGEFHICGYSANGKKLSFFEPERCEYVDTKDESATRQEKTQRIRELLRSTTILTACGYCDIHNTMQIPTARAEQVDHPLVYHR